MWLVLNLLLLIFNSFAFLSYYKLGGIIMLINSILLAISSSLDSLGIGVTYGIKKLRFQILVNLFYLQFHVLSLCFNSVRRLFD